MKIHIVTLIFIIYFISCSTSEANLDLADNSHLLVKSKSISNMNTENQTKEHKIIRTNNTKNLENFRVDVYEENELYSSLYFRNGVLLKNIGYNIQTNLKESEVKYFYDKEKEFDHLKVVEGAQLKESILEIEQSVRDFYVQYQLLLSNNIKFPLSDIVASEIGDLAKILSVKDNYNDFKLKSRIDGNQKIIKLFDFNKKISFKNSAIETLIGNDILLIRNYELRKENYFPVKEIYTISIGEFTKTYNYKDEKLVSIVYQFTNKKNQVNSMTKKFEYYHLK